VVFNAVAVNVHTYSGLGKLLVKLFLSGIMTTNTRSLTNYSESQHFRAAALVVTNVTLCVKTSLSDYNDRRNQLVVFA